MKPATYGPFYAAGLYPGLAEIFRAHGYALAIHGSVGRDFDLIAVPWVDNAADPDAVIAEVHRKYSFKPRSPADTASLKPHGRLAYLVHMSFDSCALDISFTPRLPCASAPT